MPLRVTRLLCWIQSNATPSKWAALAQPADDSRGDAGDESGEYDSNDNEADDGDDVVGRAGENHDDDYHFGCYHVEICQEFFLDSFFSERLFSFCFVPNLALFCIPAIPRVSDLLVSSCSAFLFLRINRDQKEMKQARKDIIQEGRKDEESMNQLEQMGSVVVPY